MSIEQSGPTSATLGKRIRYLRTQANLTQDDLAGQLNITRQALSNWERDINLPYLDLLEKICTIFGVHMDDLIRGAMNMELNMEINTPQSAIDNDTMKNDIPKTKFIFNKYDLAIGLFYSIGIVLAIGVFFVGGLWSMSSSSAWEISWATFLFAGICVGLAFGLLAHAIITLIRKDR